MLGVIVNTAAVIAGSILGLLFKKSIPKKFSDIMMKVIGLCVLYIGISGALQGSSVLLLTISMLLGVAIGTALNIDGGLQRIGAKLSAKLSGKESDTDIAKGFVSACLLFCVGAMTIVGSLNAGFGDNSTLFAKSVLDFISAIMLSATFGAGVIFSAAFVFVFQGAIAILATYLQPYLNQDVQAELLCAGSLIIIALGLNLVGATKIKTADLLPALIISPLLCNIAQLTGIWQYL